MFDFRYHALSLAAVLLALAVGVLLGVAIGDSNLVSSAKSGLVSSLRKQALGYQQQNSNLQAQLSQQAALNQQFATIAVTGKLIGSDVGLLFLGQSSDAITGDVRNAVTQAGGQLAMVATLREPLDLAGLASAAAPSRYMHLTTDPSLIGAFGERLGIQLVAIPVSTNYLLLREQNALLNSLSTVSGHLVPLQGLVVVRDEPSGMSPAQTQAAGELEAGLIAGLHTVGTPAVGGELSTTNPSQIPWYNAQKMSSVDDLDNASGRLDLVYELTGYTGTLGVKSTANGQRLPELTSSGSSG